jgi:hypothetical protein
MNYQAFTNDSLTMMYEAIRGALAADDALKRQGLAIRFRVRETFDWKKHASDLESEMLTDRRRAREGASFSSSRANEAIRNDPHRLENERPSRQRPGRYGAPMTHPGPHHH